MHQVIEDLLLEQNTLSIKSAWLHTSYWQQGGAKLYGSTALNKVLMQWLVITQKLPQCTLSHMCLQEGFALVTLLDPHTKTIPLALFCIEHDHHHIKSVKCTLNSGQLQKHVPDLAALTPHPEPLMVVNFDQQLHGNTIHAMPQDFVSLGSDLQQVITRWWLQWQQLSVDNESLYHPQAKIYWSSHGTIDSSWMRITLTETLIAFNRTYAQLQSVATDDEQQHIFIEWQIDFDYLGQRCRLPIKSLLKFSSEQLIIEECLIYDQQQFERQFEKTLPFANNG